MDDVVMFRLRARVLLESVYKEQETPPLVGTLRQEDDVLPPVTETSVHVHCSKSGILYFLYHEDIDWEEDNLHRCKNHFHTQ